MTATTLRRLRPVAVPLAVLAAVALGIGLLAVALARAGTASTALVGRAAPALTGTTLSGASFDLRAHRGQTVVVDVWASWCTTCATDLPALQQAVAASGRNVFTVGIDTRDDAAAARQLLADTGIGWPSVADPDGQIALDWGTTGVPETFVVAPDGRIAAHAYGELRVGWLAGALTKAVAG